MKTYWVYITHSVTGTLYVGMTSDLVQRIYQHRTKAVDGFSKRYSTTRLVYYESTNDVMSAIEREKQIKSWRRAKKLELIRTINPDWLDLSSQVFGNEDNEAK